MTGIYEWALKKLGALGLALLAAGLVLALLVGGYFAVKHFFTSGLETQVKVGNSQGAAAIVSGKEAVDTIGNRQAAEQAGAANVEEMQHEIDNATDAGGVSAAGLAGLHRVRHAPAGDRP